MSLCERMFSVFLLTEFFMKGDRVFLKEQKIIFFSSFKK